MARKKWNSNMKMGHLLVFGSFMLILAYLAFKNAGGVASIVTASLGGAALFAKTLQGN